LFENVLAELLRIDGVKGVAVVGKDGLVIEFESSDKAFDPDLAAAMVAAAYGSGSTVMERLMDGKTDILMVEGDRGKVLLIDAGENAMLTVFTEPKVNLGLIRIEMKRAAEKIAASL
jgi:predicted regulator of Ras-like GTPase activity (Roadblock/LC7/MglB family)